MFYTSLFFAFLSFGNGKSFLLKEVNKIIEGFGLNLTKSENIPDYFDWRSLKMVSPVKNQKHCAACWAFSIVGALESHIKIHANKEVLLSEQFLIDCDPDSPGCEPGGILAAYGNIINKQGGVLLNDDYRQYIDKKGECQWDPNRGVKPIPVVGFRRVPPDEEIMAQYVFHYGPLSAGINSASMDKSRNPTDIDEPSEEDCPADALNHAVVIVGYNVAVGNNNRKVPYWIIKNSWGDDWGDNGFYYLVRGRNACGITSDVSFPFVE